MNFLAIAKRLLQEAGGTASTLVSVADQEGDLKRIVDWVSDSWRDIQKAKRGWRWLWEDFTIPIAAGTHTLTLAQITALAPAAMARHAHFKPDGFKYQVTAQGVASQRNLPNRLFERDYYAEYGSIPQAQRPNRVSVRPDGGLLLTPRVTEDGILSATHYRTAQMLTLDADVPEMPEDYHMLIVWHALADFGVFEAASEKWEIANIKQDKMFKELMADQLEPVENYASTLA